MIWDADDFGVNHIISDQCQSHDCRDKLDQFHYANPQFKATLFAIPAEMTYELAEWCRKNNSWIELAVHGIFHTSNYECAEMSAPEFDELIRPMKLMLDTYFVKGFKAPGWQISDGVYQWLLENGYWVADQGYNDNRRPRNLKAYVNHNGDFSVWYDGEESDNIIASHHHVWNCVGNGVYEQSDYIEELLKKYNEFGFVSEAIDEKVKTFTK